ncbi:MAG: NAD(P)-dependent oxidoreductase [Moorea sp. SIOASIH]|uniref:NAD-dependent epimerase/dehydratase family protein n=1 Tax=Moorena sp. SIOASIH TaxID=2607817 RepID=UPI0013B9829D|nr:NAD(P)-dependent oxidoreductase [Moorena sp. SIOASIH]NEO42224.1 NAD(P)-dependent oxidoreductase [Moorena sp. SIOASIH]NEO95326.1 NAD(P)-dependent oxidoreductase [Moorena sp. SIO3G5]
MRILVTGGTGFTGSHLTRRLIQKGHDLVVLDNKPGLFFDELKELGAEIHLGSVADRDIVDKVTQGCDVVHHLAAAFRQVNLPQSVYWNVNVEGTRYLLEAALKYGVQKFVYCSTCGVHGDVKQTPAGEDAPIAPADYYQYTKYEGEKIIPEFVEKGLKVVSLRPAAIYGPGDPERFSILFKRVNKGRFLMFGDGLSHYHPLYIDNLVDAFELAADSDKGNGEVYLIADENYHSLNDLVNAIAKALDIKLNLIHLPFWPLWTVAFATEMVYKPFPGVDPPLFRRRVDWFRQNRAFSIEKAKQDLGYQPKVDLPTGLVRTAEWYREKGII